MTALRKGRLDSSMRRVPLRNPHEKVGNGKRIKNLHVYFSTLCQKQVKYLKKLLWIYKIKKNHQTDKIVRLFWGESSPEDCLVWAELKYITNKDYNFAHKQTITY